MIEISEEERAEISHALYCQYREKERIKGIIKEYEKDSPALHKLELTLEKEEGTFYGMVRMMKTFGFAIKQYKNDSTGEINFKVGVVAPFGKAK